MNAKMPKSLSQGCYGVAKQPHNNPEIVILAKNCFKKQCLTPGHDMEAYYNHRGLLYNQLIGAGCVNDFYCLIRANDSPPTATPAHGFPSTTIFRQL